MATEEQLALKELALKKLAHSDAGNHKTLLVRKSESKFTATVLHGNGSYSAEEDEELPQLLARVKSMIESASSHSTGSLVISIDLVSQGTVGGPKGPGGPGPGGDGDPILRGAAIDVHMQLRGLAEKVQVTQLVQVAALKSGVV